MGKAKKKPPKQQETAGQAAKPHRALWVAGALAVIMVIAVVVAVSRSPKPPASPTRDPAALTAPDQTGPDRLVGRWLRPDGGYVVEIRGAQADGRLDATYLNPRPINVSHAEWRREGGRLRVFIELRDTNYPGSTYDLAYLPEQDRLVGAYFQAAHRQTFDVEFVRQK